MPWTDPYLAVPYRDGGRSFAGADCLGLYALILTHEACAEFPEFAVSVGADPKAALAAIESQVLSVHRWQRIYGEPKSFAEKFDCVRMTGHARGADGVVRRSDIHLGCALGNGKVIHTEDARGPRVVALDDPAIVKRVVGVYRPLFLKRETAA
jgi:cell wall-associated NlpC family hydrolase